MYTVYKTVCLVNNKYYIGVHKTNDPNDNYLGSGTVLSRAKAKYGEENFKKEVLLECKDEELAYFLEELLVTDREVKAKNCYNMKRGGQGGFDYVNRLDQTERNRKIAASRNYRDPEYLNLLSERTKASGCGNDKLYLQYDWTGKHHKEETKQKIGLANKGKTPWIKGRQHSEETKKKIANSLRKKHIAS